jgi:pimeloyl-ACP methyl ester carboxylesterase
MIFFLASPVFAGEIQYGSLKSQHGDTLTLEYKGPAGPQYYSCTVDDECTKEKTGETVMPKILNSNVYPTNHAHTLAVRIFPLGTSAYYIMYDISGPKPKKVTVLPYKNAGATVIFSKDSSAIVFEKGNTYTRYDIASKQTSSLTLPQKLPFFSFSPKANYISGYNYTLLKHEVWSFKDKKKYTSPSSMQSYLEFSEDENSVAFLDDVKSFKTLFIMKTADLLTNKTTSLTQLTKPNTETEDYIFLGKTLYFMANISGPLEWDLFSYDGEESTSVDIDVSYGDFLNVVRTSNDRYLAYLKTEGKNTNVSLLSDETKKITTLRPVKDSKSSSDIKREVKKYGSQTGVLLSPKKTSRDANLFIWMHGGPQRQVAKGYHPYLSYAVYDELLERLAEGGNYVYKIDYTGSSGYGADFRKALTMKVGDIEMRDIENAIDDIEDDLKIKNVYLIGNSYGGYMALRGVVDFPEKVEGVVSINGVSDWYGLIQQIPSSPFKSVFNGVPDTTNLDAYFQASVFTGLEDLSKKEKVLVVWGEKDATVPVWQSTKYVDFAKKTKVTLDTLIFPTEEHILRERKTLDDLCSKVTSFLDVKNVSCKL